MFHCMCVTLLYYSYTLILAYAHVQCGYVHASLQHSDAATHSRPVPEKCQHASGDGHVTRDLEGHASDQEHFFARIRMIGRVIELLGVPQLVFSCAFGQRAIPGGDNAHKYFSSHIQPPSRARYWRLLYAV